MQNVIAQIRKELIQKADPKTLESTDRFFKEEVFSYGVKTAIVNQIAKEYFNHIINLSKVEVFAICEELWRSNYLEESFIACNWSYSIRKSYQTNDFKVFEKWVNSYVTSWASCDTLCNHTIGEFIEMYPNYVENLKKWATSQNRWVRRASAVTLIIPARKGKFLPDIFEIAITLLQDKDDLVQKGYGWMLRAASEANQKKVFDFVLMNKNKMPRSSLRYAIEKMPKELRAKAMAK